MVEANTPRIVRGRRGRIELWTPHNTGEIAHAFPAIGPDTYQNVGTKILKSGQKVPVGDYTAPLIHTAYCSQVKDEPEFENVREIMGSNWLWVFNRNGWTNEGVYV